MGRYASVRERALLMGFREGHTAPCWRTAAVMTEVTHQRCALELATDMTTRAIQEFVSAEQWEAGGEVIEALALFFRVN